MGKNIALAAGPFAASSVTARSITFTELRIQKTICEYNCTIDDETGHL